MCLVIIKEENMERSMREVVKIGEQKNDVVLSF